jgi:hypothetical protein
LNSSLSAALCQPARRRGGSFGLDAISLQVPPLHSPFAAGILFGRKPLEIFHEIGFACGVRSQRAGEWARSIMSALLMPPSACGCVSRAQVIRYSLAEKSGVCCMCLAPRDFCTRCKVAALAVCFTVTSGHLFTINL